MDWIRLNRDKIKIFGKQTKVLPKGRQIPDHLTFLNSVLTNDVLKLEEGRFNYNLMLNEKGFPIQDFFLYREGESYLMDFEGKADVIIERFNKLKLSLKVYFEKIDLNHYFLFGEGVDEYITKRFNLKQKIENFQFLNTGNTYISKNPLRLGINGYDIFSEDIIDFELNPISLQRFESIRIENCIPKLGKELRDGILPLETNIWKYCISLDKGCYIGQETIARVYFRGRPPRVMGKFKFLDNGIEEGSLIYYEDKKAGLITSIDRESLQAIGFLIHSYADTKKFYKVNENDIKLLYTCDQLNIG